MTRTTIFALIGAAWTFTTTWFLTRYAVPIEVFPVEVALLAGSLCLSVSFLYLGQRYKEPILKVSGYSIHFFLPLVWFLTLAVTGGLVPSAGVSFVAAFGAFLGCQICHQGDLLDEEIATREKLRKAAESATEAIRLAARSLSQETGSLRPAAATDSGVFNSL